MFCSACGKQVNDSAKFCDGCGSSVTGTAGPLPNAGADNTYRGRLVRPIKGRKFKGVCLALANYLEVDVTIIRIIWLVAVIGYGFGVMAYLIGWLAIDDEADLVTV